PQYCRPSPTSGACTGPPPLRVPHTLDGSVHFSTSAGGFSGSVVGGGPSVGGGVSGSLVGGSPVAGALSGSVGGGSSVVGGVSGSLVGGSSVVGGVSGSLVGGVLGPSSFKAEA